LYIALIGTQLWHMLTRDHTVLPATHTFIHSLKTRMWADAQCNGRPAEYQALIVSNIW